MGRTKRASDSIADRQSPDCAPLHPRYRYIGITKRIMSTTAALRNVLKMAAAYMVLSRMLQYA
jgi:hypothetical protein